MTLLLTAFRWLGLKASVLALCALLSLSAAAWYRHSANGLRNDVRVLVAEKAAANALAADYQARADAAVAAEQAERAARQAEAKARGKKWDRIVKDEREWAEVPVPDAVVEGLR